MKTFVKIISILLVFSFNLISQPWYDNLSEADKNNFYKIRESYKSYEKTIDLKEKGTGHKQFRRWENFWLPRILEDGSFPTAENFKNADKFLKKDNNKDKSFDKLANNIWESVGPDDSEGGYAGLGRINVVRKHPSKNELWAGAASGGLWKSTNGGSSWTCVTDGVSVFQVLGISDIAFDPNDANTMYVASGDRDAADTYSNGVLKSTDGGESWNTTGLSYDVMNTRVQVNRIIIDPSNSSRIYVATAIGIFRTTNGGSSWSKVQNGNYKDMEMRPNVNTTLYASGDGNIVVRTTDGGDTWSNIINGLPNSGVQRTAIAVCDQLSGNVYAVMAKSSGYGLRGVYKSTDAGDSWTEIAFSSPNMLTHDKNGQGEFGQGWYDLCIAVNPTNSNQIYVGGVNIWRSTNGGTSWSCVTMWYGGNGVATIHADQHDMWFTPDGGTMYIGNDGGVYSTSNGTSYNWIGRTKNTTQFYRISSSQNNTELVIGGSQDNGTKWFEDNTWYDVFGGDGMLCYIDPANIKNVYCAVQYGEIFNSFNDQPFKKINSTNGQDYDDISETGAWITPYCIDPNNSDIMYVGMDNFWKSTDKGVNFNKVVIGNVDKLEFIEMSKSNSNVIYVANYAQIFKSTNGGTSFSPVTKPGSNYTLTDLKVNPSNANELWVSVGSWNASNKIFHSTDGGTNWNNLSTGLPNLPVNCIFYDESEANRIYVGTDIGIYYKDDNTNNWTALNNGLPNVIVRDIDKNSVTKKLYAGTYGRGLWQYTTGSALDAPTLTLPTHQATGQNSTVNFVWQGVNGATSYILQISETQDFTEFQTFTIQNTFLEVSNLKSFTNYYWRAKAKVGTIESNFSTVFTFRTKLSQPALTEPSNNAKAIPVVTTLKWASLENIDSTKLQISNTLDFSEILFEETVTEFQIEISDLEHFSDYYWRVKYIVIGEESDWSETRKFTTNISKANLILPLNSSKNLDTFGLLKWENVIGATKYKIEISKLANFSSVITSAENLTTEEYNYKELAFSASYFWRVKAINDDGESDWSDVGDFSTKLDNVILNSPENNLFGLDKEITLAWSKKTYHKTFHLQVSENFTFSTFLVDDNTLTNLNYDLKDLKHGSIYYWRLQAFNEIGNSDWSGINNFTIRLKDIVLTSPANNSKNTSIDTELNWQKDPDADEYQIQISDASDFSNIILEEFSQNNSISPKILVNNKKYLWRIKSIKGDNFSNWSETWNFTTPSDKPILSKPIKNSIVNENSINLEWEILDGATQYLVQFSDINDFSNLILNETISSGANTISVNNLVFDKNYFWHVKGIINGVETDWSETWSFTVKEKIIAPSIPKLITPENDAVEIDFKSVQFKWNKVDNANSYNFELSEVDNFSSKINDDKNLVDTSIIVSNLKSDTKYFWRISSNNNSSGTSGYSQERNFLTKKTSSVKIATDGSLVRVFPNPTFDFINIDIDGKLLIEKVEIYNLEGELVYQSNFSKKIELKHLSNGTYFLKLIGNNNEIVFIIGKN